MCASQPKLSNSEHIIDPDHEREIRRRLGDKEKNTKGSKCWYLGRCYTIDQGKVVTVQTSATYSMIYPPLKAKDSLS